MTDSQMPFLYGLAAGFLSSAPIGPINLAVLSNALTRGFRSAFLTGLGAVIPDMAFVAAAFGGMGSLSLSSARHPFTALGIAVLVWLGVKELMQARAPAVPPVVRQQPAGDLALGALLCATNPAFFLFWLAALGFLESQALMAPAAKNAPAFLAGVACGDGLWFALISRLGVAMRRGFDLNLLKRLNVVLGLLFIGFALVWAAGWLRSR